MAVDDRAVFSDSAAKQPSSTDVIDDNVDLGSFMTHYTQVIDQLRLLRSLLVQLDKIRRWENYCLSLTVSVSCSIMLLFPRALVAAVCGILFILVLAGNHYIIESFTSRRRKNQMPVPKAIKEDAETMELRFKEEKNRQKSLRKYRLIVKRADDALITVMSFLSFLRSVCFLLLVVSLSMLWFTVSTLLSLLALLLFCWNKAFFDKTKSMFSKVSSRQSSETVPSSSNTVLTTRQPNPSNSQSSLQTSGSQRDELLSSGDSGGIANEKTSKKDKGSCSGCNASFASLLKRKHPCNNCGHIFCGSCTVKVPRASLGATSPAAFQQTVRVCLPCKNELFKSEESNR